MLLSKSAHSGFGWKVSDSKPKRYCPRFSEFCYCSCSLAYHFCLSLPAAFTNWTSKPFSNATKNQCNTRGSQHKMGHKLSASGENKIFAPKYETLLRLVAPATRIHHTVFVAGQGFEEYQKWKACALWLQLFIFSTHSLTHNKVCCADVAFSSWIYYSSFAKKRQRKKLHRDTISTLPLKKGERERTMHIWYLKIS